MRLQSARRVLVASLTACLFAPASRAAEPPNAREINMNQLRRLLLGETIIERESEESVAAQPAAAESTDSEFTDHFFESNCRFRPSGSNQFCSLVPGMRSYLAGTEDDEFVEVYITVLQQTRVIVCEMDGKLQRIKTRVIEEYELIDGEVAEVTYNYMARCAQTNDIYYFGEDVFLFEDGQIVSNDGSWLAGENGARAGIIMPGTFLLGARYMHENAPNIAMDRAEHVAMGLTVEVPAGVMHNCIAIVEDSELDFDDFDDFTEKIYAPGVGIVRDGPLELICFGGVRDCPIPSETPDDGVDGDDDNDDEAP